MITCDYNDNNIIVTADTGTGDFDSTLAELLETLSWCDTYNVDDYWHNYGNFMGYMTLYNCNKDVCYILTSDDVVNAMTGTGFTLLALEIDNDLREVVNNWING